MRAFSIWLEEEGYTEANVFRRRKPLELPQVIIKLRNEDAIRWIRVTIPRGTPGGACYCAIVLLFLENRIRSPELANLKLDEVDFDRGHLKCSARVRARGLFRWAVLCCETF